MPDLPRPRLRSRRSRHETVAFAVALTGPLFVAAATLWHDARTEVCPAAALASPRMALEIPRPSAVEIPRIQATVKPATELDGEFFFVVDQGVVLDLDAPLEWGTGPLRSKGSAEAALYGSVTVTKAVDTDALPEHVLGTLASPIVVYDAAGKSCQARLGTPHVLAQFNGAGSEMLFDEPVDFEEFWNDPDGVDAATKRKLARKVRRQVFETRARWLVAPIVGDCPSATWARDADLPQPTVLSRAEDAHEAGSAVYGKILRSKPMTEMRESYESWHASFDPDYAGEVPSFATFVETTTRVETWMDRESKARLVSVQIGDFESSCGEGFGTNLSRIVALDGERTRDLGETAPPVAVFDIDGDGVLEWLWTSSAGQHLETSDPEKRREAAVWFEGCPC